MTTYNKTSLKTYFETNDVPTGTDYANLIDSNVNLVETTQQTMAGPLYATELLTAKLSAATCNITGTVSAATVVCDTLSAANLYVATETVSAMDCQSVRAGAASTYLKVDTTGDAYFVGTGAGFPYGEMYATNTSNTIVVSAQNVAHNIILASGLVTGRTNQTAVSATTIEVTRAGVYLCNWSMTADTTASADEIEGGIMINGSAQAKGGSHTTVAATSEGVSMASDGIILLNANDKVGLFIRNHTAARDVIVEHLSMTLVMIGA